MLNQNTDKRRCDKKSQAPQPRDNREANRGIHSADIVSGIVGQRYRGRGPNSRRRKTEQQGWGCSDEQSASHPGKDERSPTRYDCSRAKSTDQGICNKAPEGVSR